MTLRLMMTQNIKDAITWNGGGSLYMMRWETTGYELY